jgi:hypothetical protein
LLPTETTEVQVRRHWASLARSFAIAVGVFAAGVLVIRFSGEVGLLATAGVLAMLGALGWFAWMVGDWYVERFVITDKRVLLVTGLLTQRVAIMPLGKVTDLTYERSVWGRILGYGVFVVESAGQRQAFSRIDYLPTPDRLYHQVSELLFGPNSRQHGVAGPMPPWPARTDDIRPYPGHDPARGTGADPDSGEVGADQETTPLPPFR